ncbi:2'-5' RNA ligase superfamily protein [Terribacillus saccharophilus]|uniref:2'-5' RNA ligase superfamily protein n=1 Tax=Terribacillus saccharophilus TaxID=361277 RepID=A0AAX2E9T1_9BACI|nr:2'-5' RNA ligase superfamily protein [Terribacillus saccharophilus]
MYAIVGYFDEVAESKIVKLWEELRDTAITDYPYRRKGHRPHLTFSSFTEFNPDLLQEIERLTSLYEAITLRFRLFGSFMKSDSFLLLPDPSSMLTDLHQEIYSLQAASSLYAPEHWIPHMTIANHLNPGQQAVVQHLAKQRLDPFLGTLSKIALIQITEHAVIELQISTI